MKQIIFNVATTEKRAVILEGERVQEILLDRPNAYAKAGSIYMGRVAKVLPGLQAAFVDIGLPQNGFIQASDLTRSLDKPSQEIAISRLVQEGESILVQVKREASKTKGPLLTENIALPGWNLVYLPKGNYIAVSKRITDSKKEEVRKLGQLLTMGSEGVIMRTSSLAVTMERLDQEMIHLREKWIKLQQQARQLKEKTLILEGKTILERTLNHTYIGDLDKIIIDDFEFYQALKSERPDLEHRISLYKNSENVFSYYNIESAITKALNPKVWLKNGGHLHIDVTEALTVVDVNTGKYTGKHDRPQAILETNTLAAKEVAKQLRLRNLSGMVVVDFMRMDNQSHQTNVRKILEEGVKDDPVQTRVYGFTSLGLLELTRKKVQDSLLATLTTQCSNHYGFKRVLSVESIYYAIERALYELRNTEEEGIWIEVSKEVYLYLNAHKMRKKEVLTKLVPAKLYVTVNTEFLEPHFTIRQIANCAEIEARVEKRHH